MDELQNLEQLLDELLFWLESTLRTGEILSDELLGTIAQELEYLITRIEKIKLAGGADVIYPPLDKSMPSSVIEAFKYDPKNGELLVQFKGKFPNKQGSIYSYEGVSPQIFNVFLKGAVPAKTNGANQWGKWWKGKKPSMGSSMNVLLKEMGFPYTKLT